ncbi:MAG: M48 family metalloprotease [Elusimicrobia bacterium]|nr:M48 family metalloprotease [Elusimicrobiota bacterium]
MSRLKEIILDLRYSQVQEKEADQLAMGMLDKTGMDPGTLPSALKALGRATKGKGAYFRTHPGLLLRIGACNQHLKAVKEGRASFKLPAAEGRPEIGRPAYMRRAMDEGYDYKKPIKRGKSGGER